MTKNGHRKFCQMKIKKVFWKGKIGKISYGVWIFCRK